ncbi:MAG: sulfotransferase-like domain-containing protein [Hasllibacter sp.]
MRVCVWSGPRNLSTAMMYAFGNRPDCRAMDEPFYAAFLAATGLDHPMREAVLAAQPADPAAVAAACAVDDAPVVYQKHMLHHMRPGFPMGWAAGARHVLLLRHPARVLASYAEKRAGFTADDLGFGANLALIEPLEPVVIAAERVRADPEGQLRALCGAVGVAFDPAMLHWPAGPKPFDGAWAPHWYGSVHRSTGFVPEGPLPETDSPLVAEALPVWERWMARAL